MSDESNYELKCQTERVSDTTKEWVDSLWEHDGDYGSWNLIKSV